MTQTESEPQTNTPSQQTGADDLTLPKVYSDILSSIKNGDQKGETEIYKHAARWTRQESGKINIEIDYGDKLGIEARQLIEPTANGGVKITDDFNDRSPVQKTHTELEYNGKGQLLHRKKEEYGPSFSEVQYDDKGRLTHSISHTFEPSLSDTHAIERFYDEGTLQKEKIFNHTTELKDGFSKTVTDEHTARILNGDKTYTRTSHIEETKSETIYNPDTQKEQESETREIRDKTVIEIYEDGKWVEKDGKDKEGKAQAADETIRQVGAILNAANFSDSEHMSHSAVALSPSVRQGTRGHFNG